MRRGDEVLQGQKRVVAWSRLLVEDVERGAGNLVARQRVEERLLVDDAAARRIHQEGGFLHLREAGGVEQADRLRRLGAMDRDEIRLLDGGVEIVDRLVARTADRLGIDVGVVDQHVHFHSGKALGRARADLAEADDQHGLAVHIDGHVAVAVAPAPLLHHRVEHRALAPQRHHQKDAGLGDADRIGGAGDHQRQAPAG